MGFGQACVRPLVEDERCLLRATVPGTVCRASVFSRPAWRGGASGLGVIPAPAMATVGDPAHRRTLGCVPYCSISPGRRRSRSRRCAGNGLPGHVAGSARALSSRPLAAPPCRNAAQALGAGGPSTVQTPPRRRPRHAGIPRSARSRNGLAASQAREVGARDHCV